MLIISERIKINEDELSFKFIRSPGPGGQNVNKIETGVQLKFDAKKNDAINAAIFNRLKKICGQRMTEQGVVIITSTKYRSQIRNKEDAIDRLSKFINKAEFVPKKRKATKPTFASKQRRLDSKKKKSATKKLRSTKNID